MQSWMIWKVSLYMDIHKNGQYISDTMQYQSGLNAEIPSAA